MQRTLQDLIQESHSISAHLFNDAIAPHSRPSPTRTPLPREYSNWRDEQRAWRNAAVLFDQSHHMPELFLDGRDALRLLTGIGVNGMANLAPGRAKQFVACNSRGQIIGDCILHNLEKDRFELVSGMALLNWVHFQAEKGRYDVTVERDHNTADNPSGTRRNFRFQLDGPNAGMIFGEVVKGDAPTIPFFCTAVVEIAGCNVLALRHGMAGHQGVELSGPYDAQEAVRSAILRVGEKYGLRRAGTRSYYSTTVESGWIGYPLPAIYTGDDMREFREWLPATGWEANFSIGGSFYSENIEDYYVTPFEMGYGGIVKFDHQFIGRAALEGMRPDSQRKKVTLVWNPEDIARVQNSLFDSDLPFRYIEQPVADYALAHADQVQTLDGRMVGISTHTGFSMNERKMLSLALVSNEHSKPGTELQVIWGEPNGGSRKPQVERHRQSAIRVTVAVAPYAQSVQKMKRESI